MSVKTGLLGRHGDCVPMTAFVPFAPSRRVSCGFLGRLFSTMSVKTGQFCVPINQISMGTNKDDKGKEEGATKDEALA